MIIISKADCAVSRRECKYVRVIRKICVQRKDSFSSPCVKLNKLLDRFDESVGLKFL